MWCCRALASSFLFFQALIVPSLVRCQPAANVWTESAPRGVLPPGRWFSALGAIYNTRTLPRDGAGPNSESCLVLFGGVSAICSWYPYYLFLDGVQCTPSLLNETWLFCERDKSWTLASAAEFRSALTTASTRRYRTTAPGGNVSPPSRVGHTMAHAVDHSGSLLVLFGGLHADGVSPRRQLNTLNDTWIFRRTVDGEPIWLSLRSANSSVVAPEMAFHSSAVCTSLKTASTLLTLVIAGGMDADQRRNKSGEFWALQINSTSLETVSSGRLPNVTCPQPFGSLFSVANSTSLLYVCLQWDGMRKPDDAHWTQSGMGSLQVWRLNRGMGGFASQWQRIGDALDNFVFVFYNYYKPRGIRLAIVQLASSLHESQGRELIVIPSVASSATVNPGTVLNEIVQFDIAHSTWRRLKASQWPTVNSPGKWIWSAGVQIDGELVTAVNMAQDSSGENFTVALSSVGIHEAAASYSTSSFISQPKMPLFGVGMATAVAGNNTSLVFGGLVAGLDSELGFVDNVTWRWDVQRNVWWRSVYSVNGPSPRMAHTFTFAGDSAVLHGGCYRSSPNADCQLLPGTWLLNCLKWQWSRLDGSLAARAAHAAVYNSGSVFILGGLNGTSELAAMDLWQLASPAGPWVKELMLGSSPPPVYGHTLVSTTASSGHFLYLIGGALCLSTGCKSHINEGLWNTDVWQLDLSKMVWNKLPAASSYRGSSSGPSPTRRAFHTAAVVGNKIIVHGGCWVDVCLFAEDDLVQVYSCCRDQLITKAKAKDDLPWMFDTESQSWMQLEMAGRIGHRLMHVVVTHQSTLHLLGGLDKTWQYVAKLNPVSICAGALCQAVLGCNRGSASDDFSQSPCNACAVGTYTALPGQLSCSKCPALTTSSSTSSTSKSACQLCTAGACNGHGSCNVQNDTFGITCSCQFGYSSGDRCSKPYTVFYIFVVLAATLGVVAIVGLVIFMRRRVRRYAPFDMFSTDRREPTAVQFVVDADANSEDT